MHELRILFLSPHDFPDDVAHCDGSCRGGDPPCLLHAGLGCPDDSLDTIMNNPYLFNDELLEDLLMAAALPPPHRGVVLPAVTMDAGEEVLADVDAADDMNFYSDRDSACSAPWLPVLSDSSWTTSSTMETESSSPAPAPARLVVPRKKRDRSVKRGKRLWSLDIPILPSSRDNNLSGNGGDKDDDRNFVVTCGGGGGGGARPTKMRRTERACRHCESTETPQWRVGPDGPGTLCNACGIRYMKDKLLLPEYRPSTSPSFRSDKHSNRHSKVVKLREKKVEEETTISMAPAAGADRRDFMDRCL